MAREVSLTEKPQSPRDATIDILRGTAILTMVCANSAAYILQQPHPLGIRLYGTWAAPLFIVLAGLMVALTKERKNYGFSHYWQRGVLLLSVACLFDMICFGSYPLLGFDVLYLIGIATPLAFWFLQLRLFPQYIIITAILVLTPPLQKFLGYTIDMPTAIPLTSGAENIDFSLTKVAKHWLIDGWFPIFPWLSFSFIGVILAKLRTEFTHFARPRFFMAGGAALLVGLATWSVELRNLQANATAAGSLFAFENLGTRTSGTENYSEMFYPPTLGYCLIALGLILLLFALVDSNPRLSIYKPLELLGQCSLFMYLLHYSLVYHLLDKLVTEESLPMGQFLLVYLGFMVFLVIVAGGIRWLKQKWQTPPYLVKFLLGG